MEQYPPPLDNKRTNARVLVHLPYVTTLAVVGKSRAIRQTAPVRQTLDANFAKSKQKLWIILR